MGEGEVVSIFLTSVAGEPMESVREACALEGKWLEGDRCAERAGTWSDHAGGGRQLTFFEHETLEALKREAGLEIEAAACRRNIITRGISLNDLVGREFRVGDALIRGVRLCDPCSYLESKTAKEVEVEDTLAGRGGLRADILEGGTIRVGDILEEK